MRNIFKADDLSEDDIDHDGVIVNDDDDDGDNDNEDAVVDALDASESAAESVCDDSEEPRF